MDTAWAKPPDFDNLNRYGWSWCSDESVDANYMDLAYLIARNSCAKDGHMGSVVVSGIALGGGGESSTAQQEGEIALCTINSSLFGAHRSDCHAEANAVSEFARRGRKLQGMSIYVTRAPCTSCYKLLASAGIGRIVAPQALASGDCAASAAALGIEAVVLKDSDARAERRDLLGTSNEDMDRVRALREERKRLKAEHRYGKKTLKSARLGEGGVEGGGVVATGSGVAVTAAGGAAAAAASSTTAVNDAAAAAADEDGDIVDNDISL